jgi:hypothetical protein
MSLFATSGAASAKVPQSPGPEPGSPEQMAYFDDFCRHELQRPPIGGVGNVTAPDPGRALAGSAIDIRITWDPADWDDTAIEKVLNCVSLDGKPVPELTAEERPARNDGAFGRRMFVPADIKGGRLLCEQGFVYGVLSRGGYSQTSSPRVCFTTEAAPPPPPPTTAPPTTTTTAAPTTTTTAAPAPREAASVPVVAPAAAAAPPRVLPRTGPHNRPLLLGAGSALALGGLSVAAGARRRRTTH